MKKIETKIQNDCSATFQFRKLMLESFALEQIIRNMKIEEFLFDYIG